MSKKFVNFAAGWISKTKEGVLSFKIDAKNNKGYRIFLVDAENNSVELEGFFCKQNTEKTNPNWPDFQATAVIE